VVTFDQFLGYFQELQKRTDNFQAIAHRAVLSWKPSKHDLPGVLVNSSLVSKAIGKMRRPVTLPNGDGKAMGGGAKEFQGDDEEWRLKLEEEERVRGARRRWRALKNGRRAASAFALNDREENGAAGVASGGSGKQQKQLDDLLVMMKHQILQQKKMQQQIEQQQQVQHSLSPHSHLFTEDTGVDTVKNAHARREGRGLQHAHNTAGQGGNNAGIRRTHNRQHKDQGNFHERYQRQRQQRAMSGQLPSMADAVINNEHNNAHAQTNGHSNAHAQTNAQTNAHAHHDTDPSGGKKAGSVLGRWRAARHHEPPLQSAELETMMGAQPQHQHQHHQHHQPTNTEKIAALVVASTGTPTSSGVQQEDGMWTLRLSNGGGSARREWEGSNKGSPRDSPRGSVSSLDTGALNPSSSSPSPAVQPGLGGVTHTEKVAALLSRSSSGAQFSAPQVVKNGGASPASGGVRFTAGDRVVL
jgi:hypothetical protein